MFYRMQLQGLSPLIKRNFFLKKGRNKFYVCKTCITCLIVESGRIKKPEKEEKKKEKQMQNEFSFRFSQRENASQVDAPVNNEMSKTGISINIVKSIKRQLDLG